MYIKIQKKYQKLYLKKEKIVHIYVNKYKIQTMG